MFPSSSATAATRSPVDMLAAGWEQASRPTFGGVSLLL
jgi:hypothetical protein